MKPLIARHAWQWPGHDPQAAWLDSMIMLAGQAKVPLTQLQQSDAFACK